MSLRKDLKIISEFIEEKEKILDVGCGEGDLIDFLSKKLVDCRGIELSQKGVNKCVEKGLTVIQKETQTPIFKITQIMYLQQSFSARLYMQ